MGSTAQINSELGRQWECTGNGQHVIYAGDGGPAVCAFGPAAPCIIFEEGKQSTEVSFPGTWFLFLSTGLTYLNRKLRSFSTKVSFFNTEILGPGTKALFFVTLLPFLSTMLLYLSTKQLCQRIKMPEVIAICLYMNSLMHMLGQR